MMANQTEHDKLTERLRHADESLEWIGTEIRECMHEGKSATGALLAIQAILNDYEETK